LRLRIGDLGRALGAPALAALAVLALGAALPGAPETAVGLGAALAGSVALSAAVLLLLMRLGAYSLDPQIRTLVARWVPGLV
jgi:hypothetical protein